MGLILKLKFKEKDSEKIVQGVFISGLLYFLSSILMLLSQGVFLSTNAFNPIGLSMIIVGIFLKPISAIIFLKYSCDALYKILIAIDVLKP